MRDGLKTFLIYIIIFAIVLLPELSYYMEDIDLSLSLNDWTRITDMEYKAVVVDEPGSKGKIVVTERITFDIHASDYDNPFWELWRDLPENWIDGVKVHYKVNSVKQILSDGSEIEWEESDKLYWDDYDYVNTNPKYGPGKWYHSEGPYNEYSRDYECLLFYVDGVYRDTMTFEIEYEMYNAVLRYSDCSDLYISMYSGDTIKHLNSFKGEILIPENKMPRTGNYSLTTYGTNANSFPVTESKTKNPGFHTFSFDLTKDELQFKPYNEYIEFDLVAFGEDKHLFSENASINDYYYDVALDEIRASQQEYIDEYETAKTIKTVVLIGCLLVIAIIIFVQGKKIKDLRAKNPFFASGKPDPFRDIPSNLDPNFASALVFSKDKAPKDDGGVYSAILLSLARKDYIELKELSGGDVMIKLTNKEEGTGVFDSLDTLDPFDPREPLEPLTKCENYYFDLIKRHAVGGSITMTSLQRRVSSDYAYTNSFTRNMQKAILDIGVGEGYFQKSDYQEPKKKFQNTATTMIVWGIVALLVNIITYHTRLDFAYGGLFILGAALIAIAIYLKVEAHKYVLLTTNGEREYRKWRGLYEFLKSDTLMNERTVVELPLWEKYLVYATAFGISEKVIAAIKIRCPEIVEVGQRNSIVYNSYCRSGRIRTSGRSFHSSVRSSTRSFSGGGYGGYGGGYHGGGGRGGGGGGGGH